MAKSSREEIVHAIEVLEHGRQTHVEWIDYLENENPDFETEHVGDVEHHRWYLTGYEPAIAALNSLLTPQGDTDECVGCAYGDHHVTDPEPKWCNCWCQQTATLAIEAAFTPPGDIKCDHDHGWVETSAGIPVCVRCNKKNPRLGGDIE